MIKSPNFKQLTMFIWFLSTDSVFLFIRNAHVGWVLAHLYLTTISASFADERLTNIALAIFLPPKPSLQLGILRLSQHFENGARDLQSSLSTPYVKVYSLPQISPHNLSTATPPLLLPFTSAVSKAVPTATCRLTNQILTRLIFPSIGAVPDSYVGVIVVFVMGDFPDSCTFCWELGIEKVELWMWVNHSDLPVPRTAWMGISLSDSPTMVFY